MNILIAIGRVVFGLTLVVFGIKHFVLTSGLAENAVPGFLPGAPEVWVYLSGAILLIGGLALMANMYSFYAGIAVAATLIIFVLTIHLQGLYGGDASALWGPNTLKDTAMASAALLMAGLAGSRAGRGASRGERESDYGGDMQGTQNF